MITTDGPKIEDLMTREILTVMPDDLLRDVQEKMLVRGINHAPVVLSDRKVVGMISSRDLEKITAISQVLDEEQKGIIVRDIMTTPAFTYPGSSNIKAAAQAMVDFNIHSVMVVNAEDELIGILTSTDLLKLITRD